MKGLFWLTWRQLVHHRGRSALLILCLTVVFWIPLLGTVLLKRYDRDLHARAEATPLVLGQPGNRFDLCLGPLFFRNASLRPLDFALAQKWAGRSDLIAAPMHLGYHVQGAPFVGVTPEYFEQRGLRTTSGRLPLRPAEIVLGHELARELGLRLEDTVRSDPAAGFGIGGEATQELKVCGILARTYGPDDGVAFGSLATAWLLDGQLHGHASAQEIQTRHPEQILASQGDAVLLSGEVVPDQTNADRSPERMHVHGTLASAPISALLIWPRDEKTRTLMQTEVQSEGRWQMLRPTQVIEELLAQTLRWKKVLDRLVWVLGLGMGLLFVIVCVQSAQLRAPELRTLGRMGAPPAFAPRLILLEMLSLAGVAAFFAIGATWLAVRGLPDLVRVL